MTGYDGLPALSETGKNMGGLDNPVNMFYTFSNY